MVISVSVMPYRSTGATPVSSRIRSITGTGRGALPETSSLAARSARALLGSSQTLDHTVGTPKYRLPPAAAYAVGVGRTVWMSRLPTRSGPNTPSTSPWTWKIGRPWTRVSCGVHAQASASASRSAAIAAAGTMTPLGAPVVPDV